MIDNTAGYYLHDLGHLIREAALEAKAEAAMSRDEFSRGRLLAYVSVIHLMQEQAKTFEIDLNDICLDGLDPFADLS